MINVETGRQYGSWRVIDPLVIVPRKNTYPRRCAKVRCSCGFEKVVQLSDLLDGSSKSCRIHNGSHRGEDK